MENYVEVAQKKIPNPVTQARYIAYMTIRWPESEETKCLSGYAEEWASRFNTKYEYAASDKAGLGVLKYIDQNRGA